MKIGITFDLREEYLREGYGEEETAEFDRPDTIEAIENVLHAFGHETERIGNIKQLFQKVANISDRPWDLVFNIAEGLHGMSREAQVPAVLEAYNIPYTFSDPVVLSLTLHKALAKRIVRDVGIPTAPFAVVEKESDIQNINLPFPLFAKPIAEGTGKGIFSISKLDTVQQMKEVCLMLIQKYKQPVLVETFLPGREFTVGITGTGSNAVALGVMEVILKEDAEQHAYSYQNKENCEDLVTFGLVSDAMAQKAKEFGLMVYNAFGCRDAGRVDLRADANGIPHFLEVNPLPGLHPKHSDLPILCSLIGVSYTHLMEKILESAMKRVSHSRR